MRGADHLFDKEPSRLQRVLSAAGERRHHGGPAVRVPRVVGRSLARKVARKRGRSGRMSRGWEWAEELKRSCLKNHVLAQWTWVEKE